jgi:hypothetical protein
LIRIKSAIWQRLAGICRGAIRKSRNVKLLADAEQRFTRCAVIERLSPMAPAQWFAGQNRLRASRSAQKFRQNDIELEYNKTSGAGFYALSWSEKPGTQVLDVLLAVIGSAKKEQGSPGRNHHGATALS